MTEREKVMIQRAAAEKAMLATVGYMSKEAIRSRAAAMFPLPKVSRRRVESVMGGRYRVDKDGMGLEYQYIGSSPDSKWYESCHTVESLMAGRDEAVKLLRLFDNPDELVDVE